MSLAGLVVDHAALQAELGRLLDRGDVAVGPGPMRSTMVRIGQGADEVAARLMAMADGSVNAAFYDRWRISRLSVAQGNSATMNTLAELATALRELAEA